MHSCAAQVADENRVFEYQLLPPALAARRFAPFQPELENSARRLVEPQRSDVDRMLALVVYQRVVDDCVQVPLHHTESHSELLRQYLYFCTSKSKHIAYLRSASYAPALARPIILSKCITSVPHAVYMFVPSCQQLFASVFVPFCQQLRQYLYFCTSQPGNTPARCLHPHNGQKNLSCPCFSGA